MEKVYKFFKAENLKNNIFICGIARAMWDTDLLGVRFILFVAELFWAIMLLWPGDTFARPTYTFMASLMSEEKWGLILLFSSICQLLILISDQLHCLVARIFAGWNCFLWFILILGILVSVYPPPAAIGGEIACAVAAGWIWIRPYLLGGIYRKAYKDYPNG
jgi:hypothetical protein